jgi:predicted HicB family RNase H-like nuclease
MKSKVTKRKPIRTKIKKVGRPPTKFGVYDPPRIIGRIPDEVWDLIKQGAESAGKSLSNWALEILVREANKAIDKAHK